MLTNHRSAPRLAAALLGVALVAAGWGCRTASGPCPATTLTVTPNPLTIVVNTTRQLTATGRDYKGNVVSTSAAWTVVGGGGTINASSGTFTAGAVPNTFPNTVRAVSGGLTATATVVVVATPSPAVLGSAGTFSILAGSTVTNTGATTTIVGDVGVSPGSAITGIPVGQPTGGSIHAGDAAAASAQTALTSTYNDLAGRACGTNLTSLDLGGMTLAPGIYCFNSSAALTGTLTLDAQGNVNAVFIIQIGSTLTTASNAAVVLSGGALAQNVYWKVGSSATLGTGTNFRGNIVALQSITLNTGATLAGRALARNAAVTLDANAVALPMIPELARHFVRRSVVSAMALLALAAGATRAGSHSPNALRSSMGSSVSGTIVAVNDHELLVVGARGERVVLDLESNTVVLRDGASSVTAPRGRVATSLHDVARDASPPAAERTELLLWMSGSPWILPLLGLCAIGTAGAVAVGRRISVPT